ncbi:MAG: SCP2 sterol-binding domain-containing protein [Cellvibrionales bacterium]|nr:SCP2 sterol-binding domain-containing protein [Cellvibrionales bacterium]
MDEQLNALQSLINQALKLDQRAQSRLKDFDGQSIRLSITNPQMDFVIAVRDETIALNSYAFWAEANSVPPTTHLSGDLSAFVQLLSADDKAAALINLDVKVQGDSQLLIKLQSILAQIGIDWEFHLSKLIGDIPAHLLGEFSRKATGWVKAIHPQMTRQLKEFMTEETAMLPTESEFNRYVDEIQALNLRLDRLEAKTKRLQVKVKG